MNLASDGTATLAIGSKRYSTAFNRTLIVTQRYESDGIVQIVLSLENGMDFCRESEKTVLAYTTEAN